MNFSNSSSIDYFEYEDEEDAMLSQLSLICACVMNVMCFAGILGNSLSLYIYTRPAFRKRSINILLSALSASDLCVCVLAIPVFSIGQLQVLLPGSSMITATVMLYFYPVTLMFQSMSVWLLVSITIDRYLAVCHPFVVRIYCTRSRAMLTVIIIVIFSVAYNFVRFWEFRLEANSSDKSSGGVEDLLVPFLRSNHMFMLLYQNIATLVTQFFVPLLALCALNLQVARTILQAADQRRELVASERREHSTAKMMLFIVIVFIFCYTFSFILNVTEILNETLFRGPVGYLLNDVNNILVVVNSSSSIIFYVKYSTRYRSALREFCCYRLRDGKMSHPEKNSREYTQISCQGSFYSRSSGSRVRASRHYTESTALVSSARNSLVSPRNSQSQRVSLSLRTNQPLTPHTALLTTERSSSPAAPEKPVRTHVEDGIEQSLSDHQSDHQSEHQSENQSENQWENQAVCISPIPIITTTLPGPTSQVE